MKHLPIPVVVLVLAAAPSPAATLPSGFGETLVASGLTNPTAMEIAPDGRIFVCQQGGQLRVVKNGALLATPFVTVTTDPSGERGLLGIAFDPNFAGNQFVYVYYTVPGLPPHNRVRRFTANGDVAVPGSGQNILELENLGATNHNGGAIHFGPDGKLYVAVGENAVASNAQTLGNRLGKILRINADGTIPPDNPFFGSAMGDNRAIWALGLRNPFTFTFHATNGRMFLNDVGQSTFEEINDGIAGSNYGWPNFEGPDGGNPAFRDPLFYYPHGSGTSNGCAIVGAAFYDATTQAFPAEYADDYFFADLCNGWIRRFDPATSAVDLFATGISNPVDLNVAPDGSLYYLARGTGTATGRLFRVQYLPQIQVNDVMVTEGNSGAVNAGFTVSLSTSSSQTITVNYATANGTAAAGSDYAAASGTITFSPGETIRPLNVIVLGDALDESDETFFVNLSSPSAGAIITDGQGQGTIVDDDTSAVSISDTSLLEGVGGTTTATFTVSLSNPSVQTVTVGYSTADGTANAGSDYTAASGTVTFAPGEVSQPVMVTVSGDVNVEPNETFFVNLGTPTNATLADGQGVGTIVNDDPPGSSAFADFQMLGQVHQTSVSNVTPTRWFKVRLVAGRSYAASAWAPTTDASESAVSLDVAWFLDDGVTAAGGVDTVEREPTPDASDHNGDAESIIPTVADCAVPSGCTYRVRLQATGASTIIPVQVMIVETTMASPYWQVATAAGYDAAVQIRNNTSSSVPVTFTAYGNTGSVVCSNTILMPANGLTTFGISGAAPGCGIASAFGSAQITFHGPPGSITANITTFSALSGLSFDAPFTPRNIWTSLRPN